MSEPQLGATSPPVRIVRMMGCAALVDRLRARTSQIADPALVKNRAIADSESDLLESAQRVESRHSASSSLREQG